MTLLAALTSQLISAVPAPQPTIRKKRTARLEHLEKLLRDRNLCAQTASELLEVSPRTALDDLYELEKQGKAISWVAKNGTTRTNWFGAAKPGKRRTTKTEGALE